MNRTVYVLCRGERGEGNYPVSAHISLASAKSELRKIWPKKVAVLVDPGVWRAVADNDVDHYEIHRMPVQP